MSRLVLQGKTQQEIANFLELDRSVISREIKSIRVEWRQSGLRNFDEDRGQKLAELELIKTELWQSWQESKQQKETTFKEKIAVTADGSSRESDKRLKVATRHQTATGDTSYLSGIVACIKEESKLLGLYPEETIEGQTLTFNDGQLSVIGQLMGESYVNSD